MPRLKVFCTSSGFHDSIVAAPSKPAALKAWGAKTDLFSMGVAKQVTDPKIVKKALARPGEVISLSRSGGEELAPSPKSRSSRKKTAKPPSRAKLAAAEKRVDELKKRQAGEREEIERELRSLTHKQNQIGKRHAKALRAAEEKLDETRQGYEAALADWDA